MHQHPVRSCARDGPGTQPQPQPGPAEAARQEGPNISGPGLPQSPGLSRLRSCSLPGTSEPGCAQGLPTFWPLGWGKPRWDGRGLEGACPGDLLPEVLQKLRLTSGRAGLDFFSAHQPVLLLRWGRWSCSAGWGETGRKAKVSKARVACGQFKPNASTWHSEVGHQAGSSQELRSPLERWWLWGLKILPSSVRPGGIQPHRGHGNGSRWGTPAWQELVKGEHLLQRRQAPVHHQRPGQRFGSLIADLIFCQAARKKKHRVFFRGRKRLLQPLARLRTQLGRVSRGKAWGAFGLWYNHAKWWMLRGLLSWGGHQAEDCKDRVEGEFLDLKFICVMKRELGWRRGGLYTQPRRRAGRWEKWGPICLGQGISLCGGQEPVPSIRQMLRAEPRVSSKQP